MDSTQEFYFRKQCLQHQKVRRNQQPNGTPRTILPIPGFIGEVFVAALTAGTVVGMVAEIVRRLA